MTMTSLKQKAMNKRDYITPEMEVMMIAPSLPLLAGSLEGDEVLEDEDAGEGISGLAPEW